MMRGIRRRYDVFISYATHDREWVEGLARDLESAGFKVFFAPWSMVGDRPWLAQIEAALETCGAGVVVWSPAAAASDMVRRESSILFTRMLSEKLPLVSVRYGDVRLHGFWETMHWVDFKDQRRADAVAQLVKALRGEPPGPPGPPGAPVGRKRFRPGLRHLAQALALVPIFAALTVKVCSGDTLARLRVAQNEVQVLDERVTRLEPDVTVLNGPHGEVRYVDLRAGEQLAADRRLGDVLQWRDFYRHRRLIARDSFVYVNGIAVEKVRRYFDGQQRLFLVDYFAQDGLLLQKRHCPDGSDAHCRVYLDEMRSSLPPMVPVYR